MQIFRLFSFFFSGLLFEDTGKIRNLNIGRAVKLNIRRIDAAVMETPKPKYIIQLVIPAAMPSIFTGLRVALGSCWTCVVAAELVASTSGIGYMISNARNFGQMDVVIVGMLAIGIVGKIMDSILNLISKRALSWSK